MHTYGKNGSRIMQLRQNAAASNLPMAMTATNVAYDAVGNRTTGGSVVNAGNQLTADANFAYQYDDHGNLTRKTLLATGNYTQYTYDAENCLTKVEEFAAGNPTAITTSSYRYDGLGRRIEKVANGQTKRYIYDGEDILLEYDGSNVLQARYTHGPGIDEPIAVTKGASTFFYHQDGLGTVTDLTDASGATVKSYAYDAFGNIASDTNPGFQPFVFAGGLYDQHTGLTRFGARDYDAQVGRWTAKDPIQFRGKSSNLYGYVLNDPIDFQDPSGLCPGDRKKCMENYLRNYYGNFVADTLVPSFGAGSYLPSSENFSDAISSLFESAAVKGGTLAIGAAAASHYRSRGYGILSEPASNFSRYFGLQVRATESATAFARAAAIRSATLLSAEALSLAGLGATTFASTAQFLAYLDCMNQEP